MGTVSEVPYTADYVFGRALAEADRRSLAKVDERGEVSVFVHAEEYLATLEGQDYLAVALVTWDDELWQLKASTMSAARGWRHSRVGSAAEALKACASEFLIEWNVYEASSNALRALVEAAVETPNSLGAVAANFDPAILWRREAFSRTSGLTGLAPSCGFAIDKGSSRGLTSIS